MKIQLINYEKNYDDSIKQSNITISNFSAPESLDTFDINIIDLNHEPLWRNYGASCEKINISKDLNSLNVMINNSAKCKIILILPKNYTFNYDYGKQINNSYSSYRKSILIKDNLTNINKYINTAFSSIGTNMNMVYEITETTLLGEKYISDFYFINNINCITKSSGSDKSTTINCNDRFFITSLNIFDNYDKLHIYLKAIDLVEHKEDYPDWLLEYKCFDDTEQDNVIKENNIIIDNANKKINIANTKLEENLKYKSIIFSTGENLVSVVFKILEEILLCDLSGFVDKMKEDFIIKKEGITFIGEIKGISTNVKFDNIGQINRHYLSYLDDLQENSTQENVKQLLIINTFRNKNISERPPVDSRQIEEAYKNNCLIIVTSTLLKIFEKFKAKEITSEKVENIFRSEKGLLDIDNI